MSTVSSDREVCSGHDFAFTDVSACTLTAIRGGFRFRHLRHVRRNRGSTKSSPLAFSDRSILRVATSKSSFRAARHVLVVHLSSRPIIEFLLNLAQSLSYFRFSEFRKPYLNSALLRYKAA